VEGGHVEEVRQSVGWGVEVEEGAGGLLEDEIALNVQSNVVDF
jgi:hypothetical protein